MAAAFCLAVQVPAFAGAWTGRSPEGQVTGKTYYVGDHGSYVRSAWVFVNDTWFWLQADGSLPTAYGISADGYIFNERGVYVPSITGSAYQYRDNTMTAAQNTVSSGQVVSGGVQNPTYGSLGGGVSGTVTGTSYNPPSRTGLGPSYGGSGGSGYNPSNYGPGAGGVSDPHH